MGRQSREVGGWYAVVGEVVLVAVLLTGVVSAAVEEAGEVVGHVVVQGEQVEGHGGLTQWARPQTWRP